MCASAQGHIAWFAHPPKAVSPGLRIRPRPYRLVCASAHSHIAHVRIRPRPYRLVCPSAQGRIAWFAHPPKAISPGLRIRQRPYRRFAHPPKPGWRIRPRKYRMVCASAQGHISPGLRIRPNIKRFFARAPKQTTMFTLFISVSFYKCIQQCPGVRLLNVFSENSHFLTF